MTAHGKVELPDQIPDVMQSGIHPLPAKWTVNVSSVAGYKDTPQAQLCHLAVMDAKIGAPVQGARLDPTGCAFS